MPPSAEVGRRFGDYELLEEIGRGGMGVIYRARQHSLGRMVALKMILAGPFASKEVIQRFRGEVTAAALLQHPNIVAIHDLGIQDDQHFFSMDYVEGQDLSQLVGHHPLPATKAARYVRLVAEAIHYAHQQGILHRDLKPSNVLIDAADQPRITDFGLAKRLDGDASVTVTGQMLGSPNYMPPEQASSQRGRVGRQSDVYGLGAILYHLLTARPPFQAGSFESVIHQLLHAEPVPPRLLNSSVPADLETICLKCLQKEPSRRYSTARELADELDRFLRGEPIQARPITRVERAWRWCGRNPAVASLGMSLVLAIVLGFTGVTWQMHRLRLEESAEWRKLYTSDMNLAHQAWEKGDLKQAVELLDAHLPKAGKEDLRGFEWRYLRMLCRDESMSTMTNVLFTGERNRLALDAAEQTLIVASGDTLKWLDLQHRRQTQSSTVGTSVITRIASTPDVPGLIAYRADRIHARSPTGEALLGGGLTTDFTDAPNPDYDGALALSWDGTLLAVSGTNRTAANLANGTVHLFEMATGRELGMGFSLGTNENISSLAFSPDGRHLACGTLGTKIHILQSPALKPVKVLSGHAGGVVFLAFNRAGSILVSNGGDSHIRVWSFPNGGRVAAFPTIGAQSDPAISPDGLRVASGGIDRTVRVWNLARLEIPPTLLHGHAGRVNSLLFSKDGRELYSGSQDGTVKTWDVSSTESTNILRHANWTDEVAFSPDGKILAVADFNARNAVLWDWSGHRRLGTVGEHKEACRRVRFSPDGKLIATAGHDNFVRVWESLSGRKSFEFPSAGIDASIAFHPLKPILAIAGGDLRFWDLHTGQPASLLEDPPAREASSVAVSSDGRWLAVGMEDGRVSVWDLPARRRSHSFLVHSAVVKVLCFSHDGFWLASGGYDDVVVLYDLRKGSSTRLEGHSEQVFGLAFAPDDKSLVSSGWDGTIRFWCLANHQVALTLTHGGGGVNWVTFSPDGNLMATCGSDGTARLWPAVPIN